MDTTIEWLLEGPPWVQYRTRVDLLNQPEKNADVRAARAAMLAHPQVRALVKGLADWPVQPIASHKSAGHPLHQLTFLADLGLRAGDPGMDRIIARVLKHQSAQGPFQVLMNIPVHFGGTGKEQFAWALCDAPLVTYALIKLGLHEDQVRAAVQHLASLVRDNGFPCAVSPELGKFRGPGRKDDPCPYANLVMLKVLAQVPQWRSSKASHAAVETLLSCWATRREQHPYMFFMGTDFTKLKAPLVWYDVLHVLDVLSQFPFARRDSRFQAMVEIIVPKADAQGRFTPESVWKAWQEWDCGEKKTPSRWLTLLAQRVLQRARD
ncbi:MAG: hypothetical protein HY782_27730 [Chloroflexi bacterium]|nr:hypothetical protein [Chloroflexota bacterium]